MPSLDPHSYAGLERLGRIRLSDSFHMREFLYSEIAVHYGLRNVPDRVTDAVDAGAVLCERLLEPLQRRFGRIHVRSGYRSRQVNAAGVGRHNCAADNDGFHTWDYPSAKHGVGATACISVPAISDAILTKGVPVESLAWWIHDHLPDWSFVEFFTTPDGSDEVCFNIGWPEKPMRSMTSWRSTSRNLMASMPNQLQRTAGAQDLLRACPCVSAMQEDALS